MVKIALRVYNKEISDLIDHGHFDESIAHCRHILKFYPRYIETYRLFGKSYLEAKIYDDAVDILQRVISSVPDDFVSQIGMSIIREDEGNLDAAIFHMERTFESEPSNQAIQEELRRLYGLRDGVEPNKIRLTRGALAKMYTHGNLYEQAVAELTSALAEDPTRIDLNVVMAEIYFKMEKYVEAADIATNILEKLPNNLNAHKILYFILKDSNRAEEAESHKEHWISLDPYVEFLDEELLEPDLVQDNFIKIEKLDWDPSISDDLIKRKMDYDSSGDGSGLELNIESNQNWLFTANSTEDEDDEDQYFESTEIKNSFTEATQSESDESKLSGLGQSNESEDDIPDWILEGVVETMENDEISKSEESPEMKDENELFDDGLPEWMQTDGDEEKDSVDSSVSSDDEDDPSWLTESPESVDSSKAESDEINAAVETPEEIPDWLDELGKTSPIVVKAPKDSPDWLEDLGDTRQIGGEEPRDTPEWLKDVIDEKETTEDILEETPDWMKEVEDSASEVGEGTKDIPEWLSELDETDDLVVSDKAKDEQADEIVTPVPLVDEDETGLDWLDALGDAEEEEELEFSEEVKEVSMVDEEVGVETLLPELEAEPQEEEISELFDEEIETETVEEILSPELVTEPESQMDEWLNTLLEQDSDDDLEESEEGDWLESISESPSEEIGGEVEDDNWLSELDQVEEEIFLEEVEDGVKEVEEIVSEPMDDPLKEETPEVEVEEVEIEEVEEIVSESIDDPLKEEAPEVEIEEVEEIVSESIDDLLKEEAPEVEEVEEVEEIVEIEEDVISTLDIEDEEEIEEEIVAELEGQEESYEEISSQTPVPPEIPDWISSEVDEDFVEAQDEEIERGSEWITGSLNESDAPVIETVMEKVEKTPIDKKKISDDLLDHVKSAVNSGEISEAVIGYKKLINQAKSMDQVIENINDALRKHPMDIDLWQIMGDAYMKDGQLQDALDAFSKAEELL